MSRVIITFEMVDAGTDPYSGLPKAMSFHGCQTRELKTVKKKHTYKLRTLYVTTLDFGISGIVGMGAGQSEDFNNVPLNEVVGKEIPMPEWIIEPGQTISLTIFNFNPASRNFGGYFIGETLSRDDHG